MQQSTQWIHLPRDLEMDQYIHLSSLKNAAVQLQAGELVAFPTETVYGLGANSTSAEAVAKIYQAKGRPSDNPLIVHFAHPSDVMDWIDISSSMIVKLMETFWPGPLTLVVTHHGQFAPQVTAGLSTVAIRVPDHPVARAFIQLSKLPIAAPSANRSGRPSPTEGIHVWEDLQGRISTLLDAGPTTVGVESTVIDVTSDRPILLRPGGIPLEAIEQLIGTVEMDPGIQGSSRPRSPGMKYRHYSPNAEMWLVSGEPSQVFSQIQTLADQAKAKGKKVGVLTTVEQQDQYQADVVIACGSRKEPQTVVRKLYQTLHRFNQEKVDLIYSETFPEEGLFYSVMNRLKKAANGCIPQ